MKESLKVLKVFYIGALVSAGYIKADLENTDIAELGDLYYEELARIIKNIILENQ